MSGLQLAPCPFCGGTEISPDTTWGEVFVDGQSRAARAARCDTCGAQGPMVREDQSAAWNKRAAAKCTGWRKRRSKDPRGYGSLLYRCKKSATRIIDGEPLCHLEHVDLGGDS